MVRGGYSRLPNDPISRNEAKERLRDYYFVSRTDPVNAHILADELLLQIIDDQEIIDLYRAITRYHGYPE